jgi:hypothetical protein
MSREVLSQELARIGSLWIFAEDLHDRGEEVVFDATLVAE